MLNFRGYLSGHDYFVKREGLRYRVWVAYQDGGADPANGARQWLACTVRFWRRIDAERAANSMFAAFNAGAWSESGRAALLAQSARETRP